MSATFTLRSFTVTVTTAGTRVPLSASALLTRQVAIRAAAANSGVIYLGDETVGSTAWQMASSETLAYGDISNIQTDQLIDLSKIFIDASANAQSVQVIYAVQVV